MPESSASWRRVNKFFVDWLIRLHRVNTSGVANVVTNHDRRVHALEIQNGNPWVKPCSDLVDIPPSDLPFFCLRRTGERYGHTFAVGQANHQGIDELACAAVGRCIEGHFCNCSNRFFPPNHLKFAENVKWKFCVSNAILEHNIRTVGPFFIHF